MRVLHLVGSPTNEFFADLSRLYAAGALDALAGSDEHLIAYVAPDGRWCFPSALNPDVIGAAPRVPMASAVSRMVELAPDVVVPQLFCPAGMTTYRALPELLGLPMVGNRAEVMAVGAHKPHARAIVAAAGVAVADGVVLRRGDPLRFDELPVVVKPAGADNSSGVSLVREPAELDAALNRAFRHDDTVLVERYVELGHEVRVGVLERDGELVCLPLERYAVDPERKPIRDEADKLRRADGELELVAKTADYASIVDVTDPMTIAVWDAARTCHRALGCRDYSLFDFRVDPAGVPVFLEASLYCSFAPTSVLAVMAAAAGIDVRELFAICSHRAIRESYLSERTGNSPESQ